MVVFVHYFHLYVDAGIGDLGAAGVDIFFVISGFIMVYTTSEKSGNKAALIFLKKRVLRIYPLYWFWTSVLFILWLANIAGTPSHLSVFYIISSFLLIPALKEGSFFPPLGQGWTLSFEMLFYLVFSIGIVADFRRWRLPFLGGMFTLLSLLALLLPTESGLRYLFREPIIIEFLFGVLAAELVLNNSRILSYKWAPVILIALGVIGFLAPTMFFLPSLRFVRWGVPAFFIVLACALCGTASRSRWMIFLGDASYSIYLSHSFIVSAYHVMSKKFSFILTISPSISIVILTAITVALSSLTYPLIERRLTQIVRFTRGRIWRVAGPRDASSPQTLGA
jgi:exopolysaccharide production protein ExoZ